MQTYIAMLRGINIGDKQIKMADLRRLVEGLGHDDVETYIQTGNVVFRSSVGDAEAVRSGIEDAVRKVLGMEVAVVLRTREELRSLVAETPFVREGVESRWLHVTFLSAMPDQSKIPAQVAGTEPDEYVVHGRDIYLYCPGGYGRTKLNNSFWERKVGVAATTRNWNTVNKLLEMADG
ncbi:MAG: DUF1697 domain-containing protein [Chloroflexota bacterium]